MVSLTQSEVSSTAVDSSCCLGLFFLRSFQSKNLDLRDPSLMIAIALVVSTSFYLVADVL